jgi:ribosomal protein S16
MVLESAAPSDPTMKIERAKINVYCERGATPSQSASEISTGNEDRIQAHFAKGRRKRSFVSF